MFYTDESNMLTETIVSAFQFFQIYLS